MRRALVALILICSCQKSDGTPAVEQKTAAGSASKFKVEQVKPPLDLKNPPADAVKTASGLIYKKVQTNASGQAPKRNDTVLINYTGWKQSTGETFFTNRSRGQPMPLNLATTAPAFTEAMQLAQAARRRCCGCRRRSATRTQHKGTPETLVYEVEVVDIDPAPAVPEDVKAPPANAETTKGGSKYVVVRPGTGTATSQAVGHRHVQLHRVGRRPGGCSRPPR